MDQNMNRMNRNKRTGNKIRKKLEINVASMGIVAVVDTVPVAVLEQSCTDRILH